MNFISQYQYVVFFKGRLTKCILTALKPLKVVVWSGDKIEEAVQKAAQLISGKLKDIPEENIITPKPNIAVPLIESLIYTDGEPELQEMFANLLATSMNKETVTKSHPSFAEILRQMTSDEAKIVKYIASDTSMALPLITVRYERHNSTEPSNTLRKKHGVDVLVNYSHLGKKAACDFHQNTMPYINNLCRLGVLTVAEGKYYTDDKLYEDLENDPLIQMYKNNVNSNPDNTCRIVKTFLNITSFGQLFMDACIKKETIAGKISPDVDSLQVEG